MINNKDTYLKNNKIPTKLNLIDKVINYFNPAQGLKRVQSRVAYTNSVSYLQNQGYITNTSSKANMVGFNATANNANLDILTKSDSLRACGRDFQMNNSLARALVDRLSMNSMGLGLKLKPQIDRKYLGFDNSQESKQRAKAIEEDIERRWNYYSNSYYSDAELFLNIHENGFLSFVSMLISGDVFVVLPGIELPGKLYDLKVKVIEADLVGNPNFEEMTNKLAGGVEVNRLGMPIKYYFKKVKYNKRIEEFYEIQLEYKPIPRFSKKTGLQQVLHLFKKERPAQRRGVPLLAPIFEDLKQSSRYKKAAVDAAILNALFTVFVKSVDNIAGAQLSPGYIPTSDTSSSLYNGGGELGVSKVNENDARAEKFYEMGKGNVLEMDKNQDITLADPKHPTSSYKDFEETITTEMCAAMGEPYEVTMQRFNSSFSASKAALQEAWKSVKYYRQFMTNRYYNPIYEAFMYENVVKGYIKLPGFLDDPLARASWLKCSWEGPKQGMIDPLRENKAVDISLKNKTTFREKEYDSFSSGGDWYGGMENLSREEEHLKNLDLQSNLNEKDETYNEQTNNQEN